MEYEIQIKQSAERKLEKLPQKDQNRIQIAILQIAINPFIGKKLKGAFKDCYSVKVFPFRILYAIYGKELIIFVFRISHRKDVYL